MATRNNRNPSPLRSLVNMLATRLRLTLAVVATIVAFALIMLWIGHNSEIGMQTDNTVSLTTVQTKAIEEIGEWEFLSITDEELVDTIRRRFLGDESLARIYYGTLRFGIDLKKVRPGWLAAHGDTVVATLPAVQLLDENFIDETRTKSFYEEGKWQPAAYKALYNKAYRRMRARCVTPKTMERTRNNAESQFYNLLTSMGFNHVRIEFEH